MRSVPNVAIQRCIYLAMVLGVLVGCSNRPEFKDSPRLLVASPSEAIAFGAKLEAALESCDEEAAMRLVDSERVVRHTVARSSLKPGAKKTVFQMEGPSLGAAILGGLCPASYSDDAKVAFLRVHQIDGRDYAILRTTYRGRLAYHGYAVGKTADGQVIADDVYLYEYRLHESEIRGQLLSLSAGRKIRREELSELIRLLHAGNPEAGIQALASEEKGVRDSLLFSILRLQAQAEIVSVDFDAAQAEFEAKFPSHPTMDSVIALAHGKRKNATAAVEATDGVDQSIGGDPMTNLFAANLLINFGGSPTEAVRRAMLYRDSQPDDIEGEFLILSAHTYAKDNVSFASALRGLHSRRGKTLSPESLVGSTEFSDFAASPSFAEYSSWYAEHVATD